MNSDNSSTKEDSISEASIDEKPNEEYDDDLNGEQFVPNSEELSDSEKKKAAANQQPEKKVLRCDPKLFMFLDRVDDVLLSSNAFRPQYQNVTASFADEVPFLVDGDSLMITVMSDKNWSNQLGGSSLHLVYLFERYLNIFVQRGGTLHIVFFQNWCNIWNTNWNILLFRSILINHFSKNVPKHPVHLFDNCFDENFANLVSLLRPGFILTNLEAYENCSEWLKIEKNLLRHTMNINLLTWLKMDLSCIDTNFIEVDVSTVRGYFLENCPAVRRFVNVNEFKSFINILPKLSSNLKLPPKVNIPKNYDIRRATFLTAAYFFYEKSDDKSMVNVFFLTCALMDYFALKFRGCQKFTTPPPELDKILEEWHKWMFLTLLINANEDFDPSVMCDLWQGILFGHACRLVSTSKVNNREELGNGIAPIYESMVQDFNNFGYSVNLYPISLSNPNIQFENIESVDQFHSGINYTGVLIVCLASTSVSRISCSCLALAARTRQEVELQETRQDKKFVSKNKISCCKKQDFLFYVHTY